MNISVVIPSYKPADYLWKCLFSLKMQTFAKNDFEIIIILNGCREPYYGLIKAYISSNLDGYNVTLLQTDTGGVSNARNIGLDHAQGEYIAFIDDDDYVSPNYLSGLYEAARMGYVALSNIEAFNDNGTLLTKPHYLTTLYNKRSGKKEAWSILSVRRYLSSPYLKLLHKDIIGDRRFNTRYKNGEDELFLFLISDRMKKFRFAAPNAVYYRRYRPNSALTTARSQLQILRNNMNLCREFTVIFFRNPGRYDFQFYLTRLLAEMKCLLMG